MKKKILTIFLIAVMLAGIFAIDTFVSPGKASASTTGTVTSQQQFSITINNNLYTHQKFTVNNIYQGACCDPDNTGIPVKDSSVNITDVSNTSKIAKVVYLATQQGYSTNEMMVKIGYAVGILNGTPSKNTGMNGIVQSQLIDKVGTVEVPDNFEVRIATQGTNQSIVMWRTIPVGYAKLVKTTTKIDGSGDGVGNVDVTYDGGIHNNCYGYVEDAVYTIYSDSDCTKKVTTIKPGQSAITLNTGTYYAKETTAPKGYVLDTKKYTLVVKEGEITELKVEDAPKMDPVQVLLKKVDQDGKVSSSLAGAEYTVRYFAGEYNLNNLPSSARRKWVMKTGSNGMITMDDAHKVSGISFFYDKDGTVAFPYGTVTIQETKAPAGYKLNPEVKLYVIKENSTGFFKTTNAPVSKETEYGGISIKKIDAKTQKPLAGVEFGVYSDQKCTKLLSTVKTDSNGMAYYGGKTAPFSLEPGTTYYFKETKTVTLTAPRKYVLSSKVYPVTVAAGKNTQAAIAENEEYGAIKIKKIDFMTKEPLAGAIFTVYSDKDCTKKVTTMKTGSDGWASYGLSSSTGYYTLIPGTTYYLKETTPPSPEYIPSDGKYAITVVGGTVTPYSKPVENLRKGGIAVKKVDQNGNPLKGVTFGIYTDMTCKNLETTIVTDANGEATYGVSKSNGKTTYGLKPGTTYYVKETKGITGYEMSSETKSVRVVSGETTYTSTPFVNVKNGALGIKKVDQDGNDLEGAVFGIYKNKACTDKVAEMTSGSNGWAYYGYDKATEKFLLPAKKTYYVKEIKAPIGYFKSDEVYSIYVEPGKDNWSTFEVPNPKLGAIGIKKVDQDGKALEGAEFTVYSDKECKKAVGTMTTGSDGYATFGYDKETNLYSLTPNETYYVVETKAPAGYIPTKEAFEITVKSGEITEADREAVNKPFKISKSDIVTGEPVEGATVIIKDAQGNIVFEGKTGENGDTEKLELEPGTYTFTEGEAPKGYIKTDEEFTFTIEEDGSVTGKTNFTNEPIPEIKTTAMYEDGTKDSLPKGEITLIDKVKAAKLVIGEEYTAKGEVVNADDPAEIFATAETKFIATATEMLVDVVFKFDASKLEGTTTVVFEDLYRDGKKVATHSEITDENQTTRIPKIRTKVGESVMAADGEVTITDTLAYESLTPGIARKVLAILMDAETEKPLLIDGKEVTAEKEFTPEKEDGKISIDLTFDASTLAGKSVVVFEKVIDVKTNITIGSHEDIKDKEQTVDFPKIKTTAMFENGEKKGPAREEVTVVDKVNATNLTIGEEYTAKGEIVNAEDEKDIIAKAKTTFIATQKNMIIDVIFKFDASKLEGESIVVFEDLIHNKKVVATHSELNDKDQTVEFPKAKTKVSDSTIFAGKVTLTDTIFYEGLTVGEKNTAKGILVDEKGTPIKVDGNEIRAEAEFTPESETGKVDVTFEFDAKTLGGRKIVVFEEIINSKGNVIAEHKDTEDENQTFKVAGTLTVEFPKDVFGSIITAFTGDNTPILPYALITAAAIVAAILIILVERRRKHEKNTDSTTM